MAERSRKKKDYPPNYKSLREDSIKFFELSQHACEYAKKAFANGSKYLGYGYIEESKYYAKEMRKANAEASTIIFNHHKKSSKHNEIDLHDLYVKEAEKFLQDGIKKAVDKKYNLFVITGDGDKIKPKVIQMAKGCGIKWSVIPNNPGMILLYTKSDGRS